jgi:hypothetical protein
MEVDVLLNEIEGDWWFDLGISYEKISFRYKKVISIAFVFFTIYIRFDKIKNN